jgi:hypothetical protein
MEIVDFIPELLWLQNPHHRPELGEVDHRGEIVRAEGDDIPLLPHDERPVLVGQMKLRQALLGELRLHLVGPMLGELGPETDIDVSTKRANVEVKSRSTSGMRKQLAALKKISWKEPLGYAPQITENEKRNINDDGIKVFRCDDCLIDYLGWKKKHPFCRKKSYRDVDCRKGKTFNVYHHKKGRK